MNLVMLDFPWSQQECHTTAWRCVTNWMDENLKVFGGRIETAESTLMPLVNSWVAQSLADIADVRSSDDHCVVGWLSLPTVGVVGAQKMDWFLNYICNLLGQYKKNGIVIVVHSNRAAQVKSSPNEKSERTWVISCSAMSPEQC